MPRSGGHGPQTAGIAFRHSFAEPDDYSGVMAARVYQFRRRYRAFKRNAAIVVITLVAIMALLAERHTAPENGGTVQILRGGDAWQGDSSTRSFSGTRTPQEVGAGAVLMDRVASIPDGDTIVVGSTPIRIANLDCAEAGTPAGDAATKFARELSAGEMMTCRLDGRRSYDREVGTCSLSDGRDFGDVLIAGGYCQRWR